MIDKWDDIKSPIGENKDLTEKIADYIENLIASNKLKPGDRVPSELELARRFNISRGTAGEALALLEHRGLVKRKVKLGTFITKIPRTTLSDSIERFIMVKSCTDEDLMWLREIIEPEIAALAAHKVQADDLEKLKLLVQQIENPDPKNPAKVLAEIDTNFHITLAESTKNELVAAIIHGFEDQIIESWLKYHELLKIEERFHSHREVYKAVAAGNAENARKCMKKHMKICLKTVKDLNKPQK